MPAANGSVESKCRTDTAGSRTRFLRGWSGYFRYGNSTKAFDEIGCHAINRLALFVAKRHGRSATSPTAVPSAG